MLALIFKYHFSRDKGNNALSQVRSKSSDRDSPVVKNLNKQTSIRLYLAEAFGCLGLQTKHSEKLSLANV